MQILSPLICGAYNPEEDEEYEFCSSLASTPRKSRRNSFSKSSNKDNKNPYAQRGLDKFSALLSDLEDKRRKIYLQRGSQDISLIRFVFSSSNEVKPIVVKQRDKQQNQTKGQEYVKDKPKIEDPDVSPAKQTVKESVNNTKKQSFSSWNYRDVVDSLRRPSYYFPAVLIFILVFLALFGRSVAILCTSIGWYLFPTIKARISSSKGEAKTKIYVKKPSDKKLVSDELLSPKKANNNTTPAKKEYVRKMSENKMAAKKHKPHWEHSHRKSW